VRILIADDHAVVRQGLKQTLSDEFPGVMFGEAANAAETFELAVSDCWDLLILDVHMPGRSGIEILVDVKKAQPRLPVLVLSMYPETEYAVRAFKAGAVGYIHKSSVTGELIDATKKALSGGRYITPGLAELLATELGNHSSSLPHRKLSDREFEIMKLLATGHTVKGIASMLSLSEKTIFTYRSRVLEKLKLEGDVDIARYALRHHLVE
jgi:DNA-binding NarL/FixJ family response regulator